MKDSPGNSLFKHIQIDSIAAEELEAEEDDLRLDKELKDELEREFGDFGGMNDSTDGSNYTTLANDYGSNGSCKKRINGYSPNIPLHSDDGNIHKTKENYTSAEQLQVLYDVRLRENEHLRTELNNLEKRSESEIKNLTNAVKVAQLESKKAIESRDEMQKVLVETTSHLRDTERELLELRQKLADSELIKRDALHELEMCKMTIREQDQRLRIAESHPSRNDEANLDFILKELTLKHKHEVEDYEKSANTMKTQLNEKDDEITKFRQQWLDLQRSYQSELKEKTNTIEKLNIQLSEYRAKYTHFLENNNQNEDLIRLRMKWEQQVAENDRLKREIASLTELLQGMKTNQLENRSSKTEMDNLKCVENTNREKLESLLERVSSALNSREKELEGVRSELIVNKEQLSTQRNTMIQYQCDIDSLRKQIESLEKEILEAKHEQELIKMAAADCIAKITLEHQEQLNHMVTECSKRISILESEAGEAQNTLKQQASTVFVEEMNRLNKEFECFYEQFRVISDKFFVEKQRLMQQVESLISDLEKYRACYQTLHQKYSNVRDVCKQMKKDIDKQERIRHHQSKLIIATLRDVQLWLEEDSTLNKSERAEKLSRLINDTFKNICLDDRFVHEDVTKYFGENE